MAWDVTLDRIGVDQQLTSPASAATSDCAAHVGSIRMSALRSA